VKKLCCPISYPPPPPKKRSYRAGSSGSDERNTLCTLNNGQYTSRGEEFSADYLGVAGQQRAASTRQTESRAPKPAATPPSLTPLKQNSMSGSRFFYSCSYCSCNRPAFDQHFSCKKIKVNEQQYLKSRHLRRLIENHLLLPQSSWGAVLWIRMLLGLPDPDPLVRGTDLDPSKISRKSFDSNFSVTSLWVFIFEKWCPVNEPSSKSNKQKIFFCWRLKGHWRKTQDPSSETIPFQNITDPQHCWGWGRAILILKHFRPFV
jgi:hypothetical protein